MCKWWSRSEENLIIDPLTDAVSCRWWGTPAQARNLRLLFCSTLPPLQLFLLIRAVEEVAWNSLFFASMILIQLCALLFWWQVQELFDCSNNVRMISFHHEGETYVSRNSQKEYTRFLLYEIYQYSISLLQQEKTNLILITTPSILDRVAKFIECNDIQSFLKSRSLEVVPGIWRREWHSNISPN